MRGFFIPEVTLHKFKLWEKFWKKEILILALSSAAMLLGLVNPYLTKLIIDKAYANRDLKLFITLVILGVIIFVLDGVLKGLSDYLSRYVRVRINFELNRQVFKKLQGLSYGFFQDTSTGQHLYKINYDIERVSSFIADLFPKLVSLATRSLFTIVIIFYLNWVMALLAVALTPFLFLPSYYFNRRLKKAWEEWIEDLQCIFSRLHEMLTHMQVIKVFNKEGGHTREYISGLLKNIRIAYCSPCNHNVINL